MSGFSLIGILIALMEELLILPRMGQRDLSSVPQVHHLFAGGCDPLGSVWKEDRTQSECAFPE